jgi:hypothetical protein
MLKILGGNVLRMAKVSTAGSVIIGEGNFTSSSITLSGNVPSSNEMVFGLITAVDDPIKNRNIDMGFYTKVIDPSTLVVVHNAVTYYSVQTTAVDTAVEFNNKFVEFVDSTTDYFTKPPSFIVSKTSSRLFSLKLISSGLFMILDPECTC